MAAEDVLDSVKRLEDQIIWATRFEGIFRAISLIGLAIIGIGAPLAIAASSMQMTGAIAAAEMDEKYENHPPSEVVGAFNHLWGQIDSAMGTGVVIALIAGAIALIGGVAQACFRSKALRAELQRERQLPVQSTTD